MNRTPFAKLVALIALSFSGPFGSLGCGATNTGNPSEPGNPSVDAPEGIDLLKSALAREEAPPLAPTERQQVGLDSREFALELYARAASGDGNAFISPYSVSVALAMTYAGAAGATKSEMMSALHFSLPEPQLHAAWNAIDRELEGREDELVSEDSTGNGVELEITNALFVQRGAELEKPFLDTLAQHYGAGIYAADFASEPEASRVAINDWTAERTNDRITDLLPMGSLDGALLVLLNAIYFKASWMTPFNAALTMPAPFHAPGGDVMVDMMHGPGGAYAAGDGYQALELPYISPNVRMFFILPDAGRFAEIEAGMDATFFDRVHGELSDNYEVDLRLPKFTIDGVTVSLSEALEALGMQLAFTGGADLSGMAGDPGDLFVSDVLHQAFVAVDETGTEAAAATAVVVSVTSAPPPKTPVELTFDRPFLFAIYDEPTGQILFVGRLTDPG